MRRGNTFIIGDLISQIKSQKGDLERLLIGLQESAFRLREACRRDFTDDSRKYLLFAGAYSRLAGAALQALRRAGSFDRAVAQIALPEAIESPKTPPKNRPQEPLFISDDNDLDELYGDEAANG